jgi:hypothetical protein
MNTLTPAERQEIARRVAEKRWAGHEVGRASSRRTRRTAKQGGLMALFEVIINEEEQGDTITADSARLVLAEALRWVVRGDCPEDRSLAL